MDHKLSEEMGGFINFCLEKQVYHARAIDDGAMIAGAFEETVLDFRYHFPEISEEDVKKEIIRNRMLAVFLYRLVKKMHVQGYSDDLKYQIHNLMKILCGCEIYWTADIDEGFHIDHGVGVVIGSRSKIGKGFWIHQGSTIGHKSMGDAGKGPKLGDDVILYANSHIFGDITIGDKTVIAANSTVINDVEGHQLVGGNPARKLKEL